MKSGAVLALAFLSGAAGCAAPPVEVLGPTPHMRPWAGELPPTWPTDRPLRTLFLGHLYGSFALRSEGSPGPAATFLDNVDLLRRLDPDLVIGLGDLVVAFDRRALDPTRAALEQLDAPVFNAPGNHDLTDREGYVEAFGGTFGALRIGPCLIAVLDAERQPWSLGAEQTDFLIAEVERAVDSGVAHVVLCTHKLVWTVDDPRYAAVLAQVNARDGLAGPSDFGAALRAVLEITRPAGVRVTCLAGDVGAAHSRTLLFDRHPELDVELIAVGVGETPRDCALAIMWLPDGSREIEVVPLAQDAPRDVRDGALGHWEAAGE